MVKQLLIGVVGLFLAAGFAAGQPLSLTVEAPASPPDPPPAPIETPGFPGFFSEAAAALSGGVFTAEADILIWTAKTPKDNFPPPGRTVPGGRFALGYWLTEPNPWVSGEGIRTYGIEIQSFVVGRPHTDFRDATTATIRRPFFDVNNGRDSFVVVAEPGLATGSLGVNAMRKDLWGTEANVWKNVFVDKPGTVYSVDVLAGLRYLSVSQTLEFDRLSVFANDLTAFSNFQASDFRFLAGNRLTDVDFFGTQNHFYGGQVGVAFRLNLVSVSLDTSFKLGLGATEEQITIRGQQVRNGPNGLAVTAPAGLLALPSNSGRSTRVKFSEVPEVNVTGRWKVVDCLALKIGVSSLYWHRLALPGNQIDRRIDITQIPSFPGAMTTAPLGQPRPTVPFAQSYLWLTGIFCGVEVLW